MKLALPIALILIFSGCANPTKPPTQRKTDGSFTHIETSGNLAATSPIGCVNISELTNKNTPADIMPGVPLCVSSGEYQKAAKLFLLVGAYGHFDQLRVRDTTARQGLTVLAMRNTESLKVEQREKLDQAYELTMSSDLVESCNALKKLGAPNYFPAYMVQHGIAAITGQNQEPLVTNFNSAAAWDDTLKNWLHCP